VRNRKYTTASNYVVARIPPSLWTHPESRATRSSHADSHSQTGGGVFTIEYWIVARDRHYGKACAPQG